jgi:hypothetical protein
MSMDKDGWKMSLTDGKLPYRLRWLIMYLGAPMIPMIVSVAVGFQTFWIGPQQKSPAEPTRFLKENLYIDTLYMSIVYLESFQIKS